MIPVFEPDLTEADHEAVAATLRAGEISGSFGETLPAFEQEFAAYCGCEYAMAVNSGTSALQLAVAALKLGAGDEVLVSASTNIATALGVTHNGALPVPVDSEDVTWNLDLDGLEEKITPRTRAILVVHLFGHPVDMDRVNEVARKHDLYVIEDAAEAHGATVRGRKTGALSDIACFSFYTNKVITSGEGGMVTTSNPEFAERVRSLRNLAFAEPRFVHYEAGFNFRMTGYQAALGRSQLARIEPIIERKRAIHAMYRERLQACSGIRLQPELEWARNVYWMVAAEVTAASAGTREGLMQALRERKIGSRTFFCPMNQQPVLQRLPGFDASACPVADRIWQTGLYLPSSLTLTEGEIDQVCDVVRDVCGA